MVKVTIESDEEVKRVLEGDIAYGVCAKRNGIREARECFAIGSVSNNDIASGLVDYAWNYLKNQSKSITDAAASMKNILDSAMDDVIQDAFNVDPVEEKKKNEAIKEELGEQLSDGLSKLGDLLEEMIKKYGNNEED